MGAVEDSADALDEIGGREQAVGLEDLALAMEPFGLDRVQPRALDGQRADEQAHANAGLFDRVVVRPEPAPDNLRVVPGGVVPDEQDGALALGLRLLGAPREELNRHGADRSPVDKAQPHLLTALRGHFQTPNTRRQRTPIRDRVLWIVAPLTRVVVSPRSYATSAARSKVHRLVSLP